MNTGDPGLELVGELVTDCAYCRLKGTGEKLSRLIFTNKRCHILESGSPLERKLTSQRNI